MSNLDAHELEQVRSYVREFLPSTKEDLTEKVRKIVSEAIKEMDDKEFSTVLSEKYVKSKAKEVYQRLILEAVDQHIQTQVVQVMRARKDVHVTNRLETEKA